MNIQLLSDLHLETETFDPVPAPSADVLVLAGDIDSRWTALERFAHWPVPVIFVPGNHEFDGRDIDDAASALRERCMQLGLRMLEREQCILSAPDGRRVRFVGTTRWSDFNLLGEAQRAKAQRAASYYVRVMKSTRAGQVFDALAVRELALECRSWLAQALNTQPGAPGTAEHWDTTVAITHYGPSLRSADARYGAQPATASFCNADDDLLPLAQLWIHGHLHCRHNYTVVHDAGSTQVVCNARGHSHKQEPHGYDGQWCVALPPINEKGLS